MNGSCELQERAGGARPDLIPFSHAERDGIASERPNALKAMLIAERAQNERLRQIIKELQRHRFGRRAETLPEDQMLLGLEEVEQSSVTRTPGPKRSPRRSGPPALQAPDQPWVTSCASAADRGGGRYQDHACPCCERSSPDWRGRQRAARPCAGAVPGAGSAPSPNTLAAPVKTVSFRRQPQPG